MFDLDAFNWAIKALTPGAQYYINANGLESLRWLCDLPRPSDETILSKMANYVKTEPTIDEKLASVGLTLDDLKLALGLA